MSNSKVTSPAPVVTPPARNEAQFPEDVGVTAGVLAATQKEESYFFVQFQEKASEQDLDLIPLGINNDVIMCRRGQKIVLPKTYMEVADHAIFRKFVAVPGQPRKVESVVKRFPYSVLGPATRDDFVKMMKSGNEQRDQDIAKAEAMAQGAAATNAAA